MNEAAAARAEIERLWGRSRVVRAGPKAKQSARDVARAAIRLADDQGIEALTMRSVAAQVGLSPMGLYGHFPGKFELIELMVDEVYSHVRPPYLPADGWRRRLTAVAEANWRLVMEHRWLADIEGHRPVLGPHVIGKYDLELGALEGAGLSDVEMDLVLGAVLAFTRGAARGKLDAAAASGRTGLSDETWWRLRQPLLAEVLGADFPLAQRVGAAAGAVHNAPGDPDVSFRFGLELLLDGVEALLTRRERGVAGPGRGGLKRPA